MRKKLFSRSPDCLIEEVLEKMTVKGIVELKGGLIRLSSHEISLDKEELKVKDGTVGEGGKVPNVINLDRDGRHTITSQDLSFIIKARLDEIIRMVFSGLPRAEWDAWEPTRLVLCGGSANLPGIAALGEEILGQPVRVGKPKGLPSRTEILDNPAYATVVGLLLWGAKYGISETPSVDRLLNRFFAQLSRWRLALLRLFGFGG